MLTSTRLVLSVLFFGAVAACVDIGSAEDTNARRQVTTVPWLTGAELGMGYDAASGSLTGNSCIVAEPLPERSVQGGNVGEWSFTRIVSKEQLIEKMLASARAEAKFAALGSGSARASFANTIEITQRDTTMLAQNAVSTVETGTKRGPSDLLKNENVSSQPCAVPPPLWHTLRRRDHLGRGTDDGSPGF